MEEQEQRNIPDFGFQKTKPFREWMVKREKQCLSVLIRILLKMWGMQS